MRKRDESEEFLQSLPKNLQAYIFKVKQRIEAEEDYIKSVMAGYCPNCSSDRTIDGYKAPLNEITIGICLDCYTLWCLDCGEVFERGQIVCAHWSICDRCAAEADGGCEFPPFDCSLIQEWKDHREKVLQTG
jgi:hypothetical protein